MPVKMALCLVVGLCLACIESHAQSIDSDTDTVLNFPSRLLDHIQRRNTRLDQQLTGRTTKYLQKMRRSEEKIRRKLWATDSNAAKQLFSGSDRKYAALIQEIQADTGGAAKSLSGVYHPYLDSLNGALKFLQGRVPDGKAAGALSQFQSLQGKMMDADQAQAFIQQRKEQIGQYLSQHTDLNDRLGSSFYGLKKDAYYYSQQARQYREMWDHPDQLEQKVLEIVNKLPAFQAFMKQNSQLAGLFNLPTNYGSSEALAGLQTRGAVAQQIQDQVTAGGTGAQNTLQANMQSAQSQLDGYKDKLNGLGQGNGDMDVPDFKPNDQKTKTFWKRLEYGTNFQTTHNNYYFPTMTDFGFSLGYKLGHSNVVGIGASYKLGWGNGIQHVVFSSQGVGLRSFLEIRIKSSFSATGGFEYNYTTPFNSFQDLRSIDRWTKSGLIGIAKTVSMKSRFFKKTKLQLLWDFLSYQQMPKTQPVLFRIGYTF